uniref:ribosomal protein L24 n=1 Tax=Chroothece richteriana TaxID=101928 RepID=UPI001FCDA0DF|nr:ribosomal protein L24 [Chroothece richteriana]UNJ14182.1 ribosomal protein L24 [Chroothece richteriana]
MKLKTQKFITHVKVGDLVKVISGKEKGNIGKIIKILFKKRSIIVEGINFKTRHQKSSQEGEKGSIIKTEAAINVSNVMLYSEQNNVRSRVGYKTIEDGTKVRYLIKTQEIIK